MGRGRRLAMQRLLTLPFGFLLAQHFLASLLRLLPAFLLGLPLAFLLGSLLAQRLLAFVLVVL